MGFLSSKKKVYVSSVVYNLLGNQQPTQYLPTVVFGGVLKQTDSLGITIKDGLLNGPGMRLRNFFKWVRNSGYADEVGLATSTFYPDVPINKEDLANIIKQQNPDYISVEVTSASINYYDYTYIADQYVYNNRPDKLNDDYIVEEFAVLIGYHYVLVKEKDDEGNWVTRRKRIDDYRYDIRITFTDGTKAEINSSSYNKDGQYLYAVYIYTYEDEDWLGRPEIKQKTQYIVYCKNTGNAQYDAFFKEVVPLQKTYAPYIPLRTWNTFLGEGYMPTTYKFAKKAFKRAVGSNNYDSLISDLKKNKSIGDIDFAYVVFGVALNTPYKEGKQYIFTYLYNLWLNKRISDAISGKPEDAYGRYGLFSRVNNPRQINIKSNYGSINYNIWFEWGTMTHYYGTGQARAGLKEGDYHFYAKNVSHTKKDEDGEETTYTVEHSYFCHQITPVRYEVIEVTNFTYANLIYKGKSVIYSGLDALNGPDGPNETGFIIPLQEQSFKESGLVYTSQLAQSTYYCVFNCYVVKKVRWYQSGIFGFVIAIVIAVVVTVVTWNPAAGGAAAGAAAGTGAAAGVAVGAASSTLAGTIMGAVANAIAGMIVLNIVTEVAKGLFGDKIGSIIGAVVSVVVMNVANGFMNGMSVSEALTQLSSAPQMLKLANAVVSGIKDAINADTQEIYNKSQTMLQEYERRSEEISKLQAELFNQTLDITSITDALKSYSYEPRDSYLNRTLMTGSDIAEMTMNLIHNFTDYSTNTELTI